MRDVVIAGVGQTEFGSSELGVRELGATAVRTALADSTERADVGADNVDAAFVGNVGGPADRQRAIVGQVCFRDVGITGIPISNIENACSSSSCALRHAYREIAAGLVDVAVVLGVEKMTGVSTEEATGGLAVAGDVVNDSNRGMTFPSLYAMRANAWAHKYGGDDLRSGLSAISVKNHRNALDNPYAHFHREITESDVTDSPMVADPLHLYDMCPNSDGGAAAILAADSVVDSGQPISVEASIHKTGSFDDRDHEIADGTKIAAVADRAYEEAGITVDDVDVFEVHDGSTMGELQNYEALGISNPGEGPAAILKGKTERDGEAPVNPSGGLKARGHPAGATGVAQICELVWQLRGEAGERQVADARVGLAENAGGALNGVSANTTIHVLRAR